MIKLLPTSFTKITIHLIFFTTAMANFILEAGVVIYVLSQTF